MKRWQEHLATTRESIRDLSMSSPNRATLDLRQPGSHDENRSCGHEEPNPVHPRIRV